MHPIIADIFGNRGLYFKQLIVKFPKILTFEEVSAAICVLECCIDIIRNTIPPLIKKQFEDLLCLKINISCTHVEMFLG
jgi:hypothetical protein